MNHDGVDGILDLVAYAGGEAADGGHAARELELRFDFFGGFDVVKGDERAQPLTVFVVVDEVDRGSYAAAGLGANLFLHHGDAGIDGFPERAAKNCGAVEDVAGVEPENVVTVDVEKAAGSLGDEHGAAVAGEKKDAVLQVAEDLVEVFLQGREDFFDIAHALTNLLDLAGDTGGQLLRGA